MKIFVVIVITVCVVLATISTCAYKLYSGLANFPEESRIESFNQKYPELIPDLNEAILLSDSLYSLASELENMQYPPDTLSVSIQGDGDSELPIFNNLPSAKKGSSDRRFRAVVNGGGYGSVNGQHFWIMQHRLDKYEYDYIELLFERENPETATDTDTYTTTDN